MKTTITLKTLISLSVIIFMKGTISAQSAPIFSQSSAKVFVVLTEEPKNMLIAILQSSALSYRIGKIGHSNACRNCVSLQGSGSSG